jgi:branched-subunit amino acid aminotransferase/4-amino-4-deoxychorismate lyase
MPSEGRSHEFSLLETMRLEDGRLVRQDGHLARMAAAARAHGFPWDHERVAGALAATAARQPGGRWRVRLLLAGTGEPTVECTALPQPSGRPWKVALAADPVDAADPFLRIKTTRRQVYDAARAARPSADDVVLWTPDGAITESTIANVVVELDGVLYTPQAGGALLPGVFREELVRGGRVRERTILKHEALSAPRFWLVNSLREWIGAEWALLS